MHGTSNYVYGKQQSRTKHLTYLLPLLRWTHSPPLPLLQKVSETVYQLMYTPVSFARTFLKEKIKTKPMWSKHRIQES